MTDIYTADEVARHNHEGSRRSDIEVIYNTTSKNCIRSKPCKVHRESSSLWRYTSVPFSEPSAHTMTDIYTADEVARHNHEGDLWIAIHEKVYDLTSFLKEHPGGEEVLLALAGGDGTECFDSIGHSQEAILLREKFLLGELLGVACTSRKQEASTERKEPATTEDDWQYEPPKEKNSAWLPVAALAIVVYAVIFYYIWF